MDYRSVTGFIETFRKSSSRLILLDYDGTLVHLTPVPADAVPTAEIIHLLTRLSVQPGTTPVIISGRSHNEIDRMLGHLPVSIIAEHGAFSKYNGIWKEQIAQNGSWKDQIVPLIEKITLECPGSHLEQKRFSVAWHFRNSRSLAGYLKSRELIRLLKERADRLQLKILDGKKVVEVMPASNGKGIAVRRLLEEKQYDLILAIGDDATDEEIFELLKSDRRAYTIKVGNGRSSAKFKLETVGDVIKFIRQISD